MKKIIAIIFFVLLVFGTQKICRAETWQEFLNNSEWRMQNSQEFISFRIEFKADGSCLFCTYNPVTKETSNGSGTYTIAGTGINICFQTNTNAVFYKLGYVSKDKITLNDGVYARVNSNEDYMLRRLFEYNNPGIVINPSSVGFGIQPNMGGSAPAYQARTLCYVCQGTKTCQTCKGMGTTSYYGYTKVCGGCNGTGICWRCGGTGYEK